VKVAVYNSAGELVALLYDGKITQMPGEPALVGSVVVLGQQGVKLVFLGTLESGGNSVSWMGQVNGTSPAKGGVYYLHTTVLDSFGDETAYTKAVTLLEPKGKNTVSIFNSAGELVYHKDLSGLSEPMISLTLQKDSFVPTQGNLKGELRGTQGATSLFTWDGKNDKGQLVSSGVYTIQLLADTPEGAETKILRQVAVIANNDDQDAGAIVLNSPITEQTFQQTGGIEVRYHAVAVQPGSAKAGFYDLSGRLIAQANDPSNNGRLILPAPATLAAGIYLIRFDYLTSNATPKHTAIKVAVIR
jgi:hypothetical protein